MLGSNPGGAILPDIYYQISASDMKRQETNKNVSSQIFYIFLLAS
jgi:hypothetical protein